MAVSRAPRSPQKAMAVLLGLALVFSLLLIAVSRDSDLHVVHDRTGGHFEHDHHRVFDSHGGVSSLRGGAHGGDLARGAGAHGAFSSHRPHGATVGGSESSVFGEARAGGFGGAGGAVGGELSSLRSRGGDGKGEADDRLLGGGSTSRDRDRFGDGLGEKDLAEPLVSRYDADPGRDWNGNRDPFASSAVQSAKEHEKSSFLREVWDETKHMTREVEKFAGLVKEKDDASSATKHRDDDEESSFAAASRASYSSHPSATKDTTFSSTSTNTQTTLSAKQKLASGTLDSDADDLVFENELLLRPREVDDEAEDEEVEAADDKQQALFDQEAIATAALKKKGWW